MSSEVIREAHRSHLRAHVEREIGAIKQVFRAPSSTATPIDVLHVAPSDVRPVHTLITAGMSDTRMNTGGDADVPQYLEVMMTLPRQWKLDGVSENDAAYWPIRTLMEIARWPQQHATSLKWGDVVPHHVVPHDVVPGEPPAPYAADTKLCAAILAPSLLVPKEFYALDTADRHVEFYAAIPLYPEELALYREHGMKHVLTTLLEHRVNDLVDIKRRNVARKRFGLF